LADVRPFHAVTYDPDRVELSRVLCPPYDIINPTQQAVYYERDPHNFVRIALNRKAGAQRYTDAARCLQEWLAAGVLREDDEPGLLVHRHTFGPAGEARLGVLATVRLEPWETGAVKPHEHTMSRPKEDRLALARATSADTEPIWVFYPDPMKEVETALGLYTARPPWLSTEFAPVRADASDSEQAEIHELWKVVGYEAEQLAVRLSALHLYIADGHHRYETALARAEEVAGGEDDASRFKVVLLTSMHDPGLHVLPTHRLIKATPEAIHQLNSELRLWGWQTQDLDDLDGLTDRLAQPVANGRLGFGMFAGDRFAYMEGLVASPAVESLPPPLADIDVAVLHAGVLGPLLAVDGEENAADHDIAFSRDPAEVVTRVKAREYDLGIFFRAPTLTQIKHVADSGASMPQKSTYFWPKPPSGLVMALQQPGRPL
jgi:uncharacterized protein (DUF1015 family)